ncbi:unnamed protein product [Lathyrus sativus]|nr:unnamed protein product [Lathyrus sativus]
MSLLHQNNSFKNQICYNLVTQVLKLAEKKCCWKVFWFEGELRFFGCCCCEFAGFVYLRADEQLGSMENKLRVKVVPEFFCELLGLFYARNKKISDALLTSTPASS